MMNFQNEDEYEDEEDDMSEEMNWYWWNAFYNTIF